MNLHLFLNRQLKYRSNSLVFYSTLCTKKFFTLFLIQEKHTYIIHILIKTTTIIQINTLTTIKFINWDLNQNILILFCLFFKCTQKIHVMSSIKRTLCQKMKKVRQIYIFYIVVSIIELSDVKLANINWMKYFNFLLCVAPSFDIYLSGDINHFF